MFSKSFRYSSYTIPLNGREKEKHWEQGGKIDAGKV
jgi:hypothetical protein